MSFATSLWFLLLAAIASILINRNDILLLAKVGANFSAKTLCSGVFVSRRDPANVARYEMEGIAATIFGYRVDHENKLIETFALSKELSMLFGLPIGRAQYAGDFLGCRIVDEYSESLWFDHKPDEMERLHEFTERNYNRVLQDFLDYQVTAAALHSNHTRAAVVLHKGVLIAEAYQSNSEIFPSTPLMGWSMTKSVQAAVMAASVHHGIVAMDTAVELDGLSETQKHYITNRNGNKPLTFGDLLTMSDVLPVEENYAFLGDIPRMLFSSQSYGEHALLHRGSRNITHVANATYPFGWYYSSATSNVLARELRRRFRTDFEYLSFPYQQIFSKIGAHSFVLETDPSGTFAASSFSYAVARDWAKLGQLFLQKGRWGEEQVLDESVMEFIRLPRNGSSGLYGGSVWLNPSSVSDDVFHRELPANDRNKLRHQWMRGVLPADAFFMSGFEGQYVYMIPSLDLVIVRLGMTKDVPGEDDPAKPEVVAKFDRAHFFGSIVDIVKRHVAL